MKCRVCGKKCIKNGFQKNGRQRYFCGLCKKSTQKHYSYKAYKKNTNKSIYTLLINSCGITDISRVLNISRQTVTKRLFNISKQIKQPVFNEYYQSYEVDEMQVKVLGKGNYCYLSYAINRTTKTVANFIIGNRTAEYLNEVISKVLQLNPKRIYTDNWGSYNKIIPKAIHKKGKIFANRIERSHLNLRTHLKCLSRKTICYAKCIKTLEAIVRIYFWGNTLNFKYV